VIEKGLRKKKKRERSKPEGLKVEIFDMGFW